MAQPAKRSRIFRRLWEAWQHVDAARSLIQLLLSLGWIWLAVITYGGAILSVVVSVVLVALGSIANWSPYIVGVVAIIVATIPNYLMFRYRHIRVSPAVSPSERLILVAPLDGEAVTNPFDIRGFANAMEGNIIVETKNNDGGWDIVANTMAALGPQGHLYSFSTQVSLDSGKHPLRVCAEPFMADERFYGDCAEVEVTVT